MNENSGASAINSRWEKSLVSLAVALVLAGRLLLQLVLYRSGFVALTADEFGRVFDAARWAQDPRLVWSGLWLPFHEYLFGTALALRWDLLTVPRVITAAFGLLSILLTYQLTLQLFGSRRTALVGAVLLAVSPAHVWLGSTPLTELPYATLILAFMVAFTRYLRDRKLVFLYFGALLLGLANGFRFEGWILSGLFSLYLLGEGLVRLRRGDLPGKRFFALLVAAAVPWIFPAIWIIGNYLEQGDPLHFFRGIKAYKLVWYGEEQAYEKYLETFFRLDPYATVLSVVALAVCLFRHRRSPAVRWFTIVAVVPFLVFAYLHGGQLEPPGNYVRYLAPFLFMVYPALAYTICLVVDLVTRSQAARTVLLTLVLAIVVATQVRTTLSFSNDPAAEGLAVGQRIAALREEYPALAQRPVLIERTYWQYLAIHVGANDMSMLIFDRPWDPKLRHAPSPLLSADAAAIRDCLAFYDVTYVVVRTPELFDILEQDLGLVPSEEINTYYLYPVPEELVRQEGVAVQTCSLALSLDYP